MTEQTLNWIISTLKGIPCGDFENSYDVVGFLECHRVSGLFYNTAKHMGMTLPKKIEKLLRNQFELQKRRVILFREYIRELSDALINRNANHIFLKGSVLTNYTADVIYADGERSSNDIDLLVKPSDLSVVSDVLLSLGYVQGEYRLDNREIVPFSRDEIIRRRMTRGEIAPYIKLTDDEENPYIEVDINFSLGNTPTAYRELLYRMVDTRERMEGKVFLYVANSEMFFIHLTLITRMKFSLTISVFARERAPILNIPKTGC